jgi:hypothetical protein
MQIIYKIGCRSQMADPAVRDHDWRIINSDEPYIHPQPHKLICRHMFRYGLIWGDAGDSCCESGVPVDRMRSVSD